MLHPPRSNPLAQTTSGARANHIWCSRAIGITARAQPDSQSARARNMQLDGETYPGRRKKAAAPAVALPNLDPESPVLQLAAKRQRLLDIAALREDLDKEEHRLKEEMKSLYEKLGRELFGSDLHQK